MNPMYKERAYIFFNKDGFIVDALVASNIDMAIDYFIDRMDLPYGLEIIDKDYAPGLIKCVLPAGQFTDEIVYLVKEVQ